MIYLFNHSEELIGELKSEEIIEAVQEEILNGLIRLDFSITLNAKSKMENVEFVAHKDVNEEEYFYMYKIVSVGNEDEALHFTAINIAYDDLKAYGYLREYRMEKTTGALALETILNGSRWCVGIAEETAQKDLFIYDLSRLEALSKLINTFNVELNFRIKISGNKITSRIVDIYNTRGKITNKRFVYGSNALSIIREESQQELFTAVIGRGKGEEKFNAEGESTGGFGRRINFKSVEWKKADGKPLDKPFGQEYIELPEATKIYGYSDGTPRTKLIVHDSIEEPEELLEACYKDLMEGSRPLVQFKSNIAKIGRLNLGDTVNIIRHDLEIYYTARIFKLKRDLKNPLNTEVELGDNLEYNQAKKNKELVNNIKELNTRVTEVAKSANNTFVEVVRSMRKELTDSYFNDDGYNYDLRAGNAYGLPSGYYSFDRPIDQGPTKVIYMGAGKMAIANRKDDKGAWEWRTFGTGDGLLAETIIGTLGEFAKVNANQINVDSDFTNTQLGQKVVVQDELYNNVKITQDKGIQVLDNQARERVQLGNWASGRYGLKLSDITGQRTVLDDEGILQSWQDGRCDNCDDGHPLKLHLYIPKETSKIYKAVLRVYIDPFRAYSKGASAGGGTTETSSTDGDERIGTTTDYEGWTGETTHGEKQVDGSNRDYRVYSNDPNWSGHVTIYHVDHHEHNYELPRHHHEFNYRLDGHSHSVRFPDHEHGLVYGIYEEHNSSDKMEVYINGSDRTSSVVGSGYFSGNQNECNITPYLNKGQWNEIQIRTRERMRIDASVFIQALLQYSAN